MDACGDNHYNENGTDKPADDELDESSFVFLGLDFQLAELRCDVLEVNLTAGGRIRSTSLNRRVAELGPGSAAEPPLIALGGSAEAKFVLHPRPCS